MDDTEIQLFNLPGVFEVDAMDELREWLSNALEIGEIQINGAEVTRLVTNALLLLVSAKATAEKNKIAFSIVNPSPAFGEAVERLGMGNIISPILQGN
ncbi:MAG: STAS domain-containing protein [Devosiaceae bacterium]|nr:STAS domain-containing protein [Devosiaceae bacterium]